MLHLPRLPWALFPLAVFVGWAVLGEAAVARADDEVVPPRNIEELNLEQLLGKVTAASRTEESVLTAPATVTVLDENDIRQTGANTIPDLLRKVAGVQVLELSPGDYVVALRGTSGLTGNNVVVLLDGVPLNSRIDGGVDWGAIPIDLSQIARIEVVRGPVSTIYGPNAYTGVINIQSRPPSEEGTGKLVHIQGGIGNGPNGMGAAALSISGKRGKLSGRLQLNGRYDLLNAPAGATAWALGGGTALIQYDASETTRISLQLGGSYSQRNALDHLVLEPLKQQTTSAFALLRIIFRDLPGYIDALEFWQRTRLMQIGNSDEFAGFSYSGANAADANVGFDLRFAFPYDFHFAVGANAGVEYVDAPFIHPLETGKLRPRYGFYADLGVDIKKRLSLSIAARGDASALVNGLRFAGRASIIYHASKWALRFTAGGAYRDPTYVEVASRFIDRSTNLIQLEGTPGLNAPQIISAELGAIIAPILKLTIKPTIYYAELSNLMIEDFQPLVRRTFINEQDSRRVLGTELELSLQVIRQLYLEANVIGLFWLQTPDSSTPPTVGDPDQNSTVIAWLGTRSSFLDGRLSMSLGGGYTSPRRYTLRAGIPPSLFDVPVGHSGRLEAAGEWRPTQRVPFYLTLRLMSFLPNAAVETPFAGASRLGTSVILAASYR